MGKVNVLIEDKMFTELTMSFDPYTISILKTEFELHQFKLTKNQFILVLKEHLLNWYPTLPRPKRQKLLIKFLAMVYEDIDINNNGRIDWDTFSEYLYGKSGVHNSSLFADQVDAVKGFTRSNDLKPANKEAIKLSEKVSPTFYLSAIDRILLIEDKKEHVSFVNPENGIVIGRPLDVYNDESVNFAVAVPQGSKKRSVLAALYISDGSLQLLMTATEDKKIKAWQLNNNTFVSANKSDPKDVDDSRFLTIKCDPEACCLAWDEIHKVLYSGNREGGIMQWDIRTGKQVSTMGGKSKKLLIDFDPGHTEDTTTGGGMMMDSKSAMGGSKRDLESKESHMEDIVGLVLIPKLQYLVSASNDSNINLILWDTIQCTKRRIYREHTKGLLALAYSEEHMFIFSGGFDHQICVWTPHITTPITKLLGHSEAVKSIEIITGTHILVTADSNSNIKIWDIRSFDCVQTIKVGENYDNTLNKFALNKVVPIWDAKVQRLFVLGKERGCFYDYDKNYNHNLIDECTPLSIEYHPKLLEFVTPVGRNIKIWNALNGQLKKVLRGVTTSEITTFRFDSAKKRFVVGDNRGEIKVYNYFSGCFMKQLRSHKGEVTDIILYSDKSKIIISCANDKELSILFHDDSLAFEAKPILKKIDFENFYPICLDITLDRQLIVAFSNGIIKSWEIENGRLDGSWSAHKVEINAMVICNTYNFLFTCDSFGSLILWTLPPFNKKYQKILKMYNLDEVGEGCAILSMSLDEKNLRLFIGDEKGTIKAYCFENAVHEFGLTPQNVKTRITLIKTDFHKMDNSALQLIWEERQAHTEGVNCLQYVSCEPHFLMSTGFNKKVKLWDGETGVCIDYLRQGMKNHSRPIAFIPYNKPEEIKEENKKKKGGIKLKGPNLEELFGSTFPELEFNTNIERLEGSSTPWKLQLNISDIMRLEERNLEELTRSMKGEEEKEIIEKVEKVKGRGVTGGGAQPKLKGLGDQFEQLDTFNTAELLKDDTKMVSVPEPKNKSQLQDAKWEGESAPFSEKGRRAASICNVNDR